MKLISNIWQIYATDDHKDKLGEIKGKPSVEIVTESNEIESSSPVEEESSTMTDPETEVTEVLEESAEKSPEEKSVEKSPEEKSAEKSSEEVFVETPTGDDAAEEVEVEKVEDSAVEKSKVGQPPDYLLPSGVGEGAMILT